jgi:formate dehydrogenase subunit gamma
MRVQVQLRIKGLLVSTAIVLAAGAAWAASPDFPTLRELPSGKAALGWEEFVSYREVLRWSGGIFLGVVVVLALTHLFFHGAHRIRPTGHKVKRYSLKEIFLHDLLALAFVGTWASATYLILAKYFLGYAKNGFPVPLGGLSSTIHIVTGLLFFVALLALVVAWWRAMQFASYDRDWLKGFGGYLSRRHRILPAGRFNAGQKVWFLTSLGLGVLVSVSGALIYYPGLMGPRWDIILYVAHTVLGVLFSGGVIVHLYLAVVVHPWAFRGMVTGEIDEAGVRQAHPLESLPATGGSPR